MLYFFINSENQGMKNKKLWLLLLIPIILPILIFFIYTLSTLIICPTFSLSDCPHDWGCMQTCIPSSCGNGICTTDCGGGECKARTKPLKGFLIVLDDKMFPNFPLEQFIETKE
jgi:hypothetical protein